MKKIVPFLCVLIMFCGTCMNVSAEDIFMTDTAEYHESEIQVTEKQLFGKTEKSEKDQNSGTAVKLFCFGFGAVCGATIAVLISVLTKKNSSDTQNIGSTEEISDLINGSRSKLKKCTEIIEGISESVDSDKREISDLINRVNR